MGRMSAYYETFQKCCCSRRKHPPPGPDTLNVVSKLQSNQQRQEHANFVCKALLMKLCQFIVITGYFFFILQLSSAFKSVSLWWIIIPCSCYFAISICVRLKKRPPHFSIMLIMHILISFCFSFIIGIMFTKFDYAVISLPVSVLFVYVAYLILIPLFFTQMIFTGMKNRKYYLIPLSTIWIQNLIFIAIVASLPPYKTDDKLKKMGIYILPTILLSNLLTWVSLLQIRQMLQGKWFHVQGDHLYDYMYAALYLF